ncbi:SDR family NAD(P)-dependent oxidoreductase [Halomonas sp. H5]|uniref:SDR family NAD(P)-dependent oxidoreductase n=1 Tax=Halomonas sp. H5 TaxID=3423910 RepID=UPI003D36AA32
MRVLITGASRGIGAGIARKLAEDALKRGDTPSLVLTASRQGEELTAIVEELQARGARALAVAGDMADPETPARLVEAAVDFCGGLDGVVSNVGVMAPGRLAELERADWERLHDINVRGPWLLAKAAYPVLKASRGSLVNIASMVGVQPHPGSGAYSTSKAALIMLTQQLALEWAVDGIRVNSVSPGMIHTSATDKLYQQPEVVERREQVIPLHQIGQPAHIAGVVAFLLGREAAYMTGQNLLADGGFAGAIMSHIPGLPSRD